MRTVVTRTAGAVVSALALLIAPAVAPAASNAERLTGYGPEHAQRQLRFEADFRQAVNADNIGEFSRLLTSKPQLVGTPGAERSAAESVRRLRDYGLDVKTYDYQVYASVPRDIRVTMTAPRRRQLAVKERGFPWLGDFQDVVPGYNAYSPPGDVSGQVVYANYGRPEDFAALDRLGVDVQNKIVLTRYGENFRGVKSSQAEQRGARGVLIYSDPADDGFTRGPVYPKGPFRPADAIQRGSVQYLWQYPGDPLTPGKPSVPGTPRIDREEAENLPSIPTTPISYGEAEPLLRALGGPEAPEEFQGGLDFDYHVGPGSTEVNLDLDIDYRPIRVRDVVAEIPGASKPEETVLLGGHYDAWTYGAEDNTSAWSTTVEIGRVLADMAERGWRPERTITLTGWDGEEYGLLGSTEYVEQFEQALGRNAVAYINMDGVAGDEFEGSGVPAADDLLTDVTRRVRAPRGNGSVYDSWRGNLESPEVERPGSGSDYTGFLDRLGVPIMDVGFSKPGGQYHAAYDDTVQTERFLDPGYRGHAAAARVTGTSALRLANADIVPLRYSSYGPQVRHYVRQLQREQQETPGSSTVDLTPLLAGADRWTEAAKGMERRGDELLARGDLDDPRVRHELRAINAAVRDQERLLTTPRGLPGRPWYRHQIYAPGVTTGYAVQYLPGLTDAVLAGDDATVRQYRDSLLRSLDAAARAASRVA